MPAQAPLGQRLGPPVGDQADIRGRAAHVEGDRVAEPERAREEARGGDARRRAPTPPWRAGGAARPSTDIMPPLECSRWSGRADARPGERGLEVVEVARRRAA